MVVKDAIEIAGVALANAWYIKESCRQEALTTIKTALSELGTTPNTGSSQFSSSLEVNHIHGLHALLQQLIDQGRMPIAETVQQYISNSRAQLHQLLVRQGEDRTQTNNSDKLLCVRAAADDDHTCANVNIKCGQCIRNVLYEDYAVVTHEQL